MRSRYGLTTLALILTSAVTLTAPALAAPGQSGAHAPLYYVALGDSLSVGVQPDATGMNRASDEGYPDQLHALLRTTMPHLGGNLGGRGCRPFSWHSATPSAAGPEVAGDTAIRRCCLAPA